MARARRRGSSCRALARGAEPGSKPAERLQRRAVAPVRAVFPDEQEDEEAEEEGGSTRAGADADFGGGGEAGFGGRFDGILHCVDDVDDGGSGFLGGCGGSDGACDAVGDWRRCERT